ncbi:hypothetical protein QTP88_008081 [Uroleucon formosanum]
MSDLSSSTNEDMVAVRSVGGVGGEDCDGCSSTLIFVWRKEKSLKMSFEWTVGSKSTKNRGNGDLLVLCRTFVTFLSSKRCNSSSLLISSVDVEGLGSGESGSDDSDKCLLLSICVHSPFEESSMLSRDELGLKRQREIRTYAERNKRVHRTFFYQPFMDALESASLQLVQSTPPIYESEHKLPDPQNSSLTDISYYNKLNQSSTTGKLVEVLH